MTSVHDLATYLTYCSKSPMATMKIHKLCYYVQGYHLAWAGEPLFAEPIEARKSGPVVPALFDAGDLTVVDSWPRGRASDLTPDQTKVANVIIDHYDFHSGIDLSETSRLEAPWIRAMEQQVPEGSYPVIDLSVMKAFFRALDDAPGTRHEYANRFIDQYA